MRKLSLFSVLFLLCSSAFAQDGFFEKSSFGMGAASSSFKMLSSDAYNNDHGVLSWQAQYNAGYTHGHWQVETGIGYLQTGVNFVKGANEPLCGMPPLPGTTPTIQPVYSPSVKYTIKNAHITMPLAISYVLNAGKKVSIVPGVGMEASYNLKGKITESQQSEQGTTPTINYHYNPISALVMAKLEVDYKLCSHMSVFVCPSYQQMVTSLTTKVQGDYMSRTYDHALLMNFGVKCSYFCCHHTPSANGAKN